MADLLVYVRFLEQSQAFGTDVHDSRAREQGHGNRSVKIISQEQNHGLAAESKNLR